MAAFSFEVQTTLTRAPEVVIGRVLAACVHPCAAWRVLPRADRVLMCGAYFAGAFVMTLGALMLALPSL